MDPQVAIRGTAAGFISQPAGLNLCGCSVYFHLVLQTVATETMLELALIDDCRVD